MSKFFCCPGDKPEKEFTYSSKTSDEDLTMSNMFLLFDESAKVEIAGDGG